MPNPPRSIRYLVLGEGVRDIQWQDLTLDAPFTSYAPPTFTPFPVAPSLLGSVAPTVRMYPADVAISFPPTMNGSSAPARPLPVSPRADTVPADHPPIIQDAAGNPATAPTSLPLSGSVPHRFSTSGMIAPPAPTNPPPTADTAAAGNASNLPHLGLERHAGLAERSNMMSSLEGHSEIAPRARAELSANPLEVSGGPPVPPTVDDHLSLSEALDTQESRQNQEEKRLSSSEFASQQAQNEALQSIIAKAEKRRARSNNVLPSLPPKTLSAAQTHHNKPVASRNVMPQGPSSAHDPRIAAQNVSHRNAPPGSRNGAPVNINPNQPARDPVISSPDQHINALTSIHTTPEQVDRISTLQNAKAKARPSFDPTPSKSLSGQGQGQGKQDAQQNSVRSGEPGQPLRLQPLQAMGQDLMEVAGLQRRPSSEQNLPLPRSPTPPKPTPVGSDGHIAAGMRPVDPQQMPVAGWSNDLGVEVDYITPVTKKPTVSNDGPQQSKSGEARVENQGASRIKALSRPSESTEKAEELLDEMGTFLKQFLRVIKALSESGDPKFDLRKVQSRRNQENFLTKLLENFAKLHNIEGDLSINRNDGAGQSRSRRTDSKTSPKERSRRSGRSTSRPDEPSTKKAKTGTSGTPTAGGEAEQKSISPAVRPELAKRSVPERNWNNKTQEAFDRSLRVIRLFPQKLQSWGSMMKRGMDKSEELILAAGRVQVNIDSLQKPLTWKEVSNKEVGSWLISLNENGHVYSHLWHVVKAASESRTGRKKDDVDLCSRYLEGIINLLIWADTVIFWVIERCMDALAASETTKDTIVELERITVSFLNAEMNQNARSNGHLMDFLKKLPVFIDDPRFELLDGSLSDSCKSVKEKVKQLSNNIASLSECSKDLTSKIKKLAVNEDVNGSGGSEKGNGNKDGGSEKNGGDKDTDGGPNPGTKRLNASGDRDLSTKSIFADDIPIPRRKLDDKEGTEREKSPSPRLSNSNVSPRHKPDSLRERERSRSEGPQKEAGQITPQEPERPKRRHSDSREFKSPNNQSGAVKNPNPPSSRNGGGLLSVRTPNDRRNSAGPESNPNGRDYIRPAGETFKAFHPTKASYNKGASASNDSRAAHPTTDDKANNNISVGTDRSQGSLVSPSANQTRAGNEKSPKPDIDQPAHRTPNEKTSGIRGILKKTSMPDKPSRTSGRRVTFAERPRGYSSAYMTSEETETLFHDGYDLLGESNPVQAALVRERTSAMSRGSVFVIFAFFQHVVNVMKHQQRNLPPPDIERLRIPYPPSTIRHLERTLDISLASPHNLGASPPTRPMGQAGRTTYGGAPGISNGPPRVGIHTPITGLRSAPSPLPTNDRHSTTTGLRSVPIRPVSPPSPTAPKYDPR